MILKITDPILEIIEWVENSSVICQRVELSTFLDRRTKEAHVLGWGIYFAIGGYIVISNSRS